MPLTSPLCINLELHTPNPFGACGDATYSYVTSIAHDVHNQHIYEGINKYINSGMWVVGFMGVVHFEPCPTSETCLCSSCVIGGKTFDTQVHPTCGIHVCRPSAAKALAHLWGVRADNEVGDGWSVKVSR